MQRLLRISRPGCLLAAALVAACVWAAVAHRSWISAQARAVVVVATTLETPVLTWAVERLTEQRRLDEVAVAGSPTTLVRPAGDGPWPAIVFVNGATRFGRHHPEVRDLARGLGRAGYLVLVPDLPGLRAGEISVRTERATVAVARAALARPDAEGGRVALVGVSVGATLALLAAENEALADRISLVAGIAPYTSLENVLRLATTRTYPSGGRLVSYVASPFVALVVARSLAVSLPPGPDRRHLLAKTRAIDDDSPDPLAEFRSGEIAAASPAGRAVVALLANRDPRRFDELYATLPEELRAVIERLSPIAWASRLRAPVELASAPHDRYFPVDESHALARRAPTVRVTVTAAFGHAVPRPSLRDPGDLFRFDLWAVRSLRAAG